MKVGLIAARSNTRLENVLNSTRYLSGPAIKRIIEGTGEQAVACDLTL
jgi:hypothetical protein